MPVDFEALVQRYVQVRDAKSQLTKDHKEKVERLDALLEQLEGVLLREMRAMNMESVRTTLGTAYKTTKTQARVGDWDAIVAFVKQTGAYEFFERRITKKAVEEYREATGQLPPGVDWSEELTINVRR